MHWSWPDGGCCFSPIAEGELPRPLSEEVVSMAGGVRDVHDLAVPDLLDSKPQGNSRLE